MLITKTIEIDAGHRVPNHKSKCRNLHGHRYVIEVAVDDQVITKAGDSSEGMVIDFGDLKQIMIELFDYFFDHSFIVYSGDELIEAFKLFSGLKIVFVPFIPTAENLAKYWYEAIKPRLTDKQIKIKHVKVWETPSSTATYEERN